MKQLFLLLVLITVSFSSFAEIVKVTKPCVITYVIENCDTIDMVINCEVFDPKEALKEAFHNQLETGVYRIEPVQLCSVHNWIIYSHFHKMESHIFNKNCCCSECESEKDMSEIMKFLTIIVVIILITMLGVAFCDIFL